MCIRDSIIEYLSIIIIMARKKSPRSQQNKFVTTAEDNSIFAFCRYGFAITVVLFYVLCMYLINSEILSSIMFVVSACRIIMINQRISYVNVEGCCGCQASKMKIAIHIFARCGQYR